MHTATATSRGTGPTGRRDLVRARGGLRIRTTCVFSRMLVVETLGRVYPSPESCYLRALRHGADDLIPE